MAKSKGCKARRAGRRCGLPVAVNEQGLCVAHYKRVQRTGATGPVEIGEHRPLPLYMPPNAVTTPGICAVRRCGKKVEYPRYKFCRPHYERYRVQFRVEGLALKDIVLIPIGEAKPGPRQSRPKKKAKAA